MSDGSVVTDMDDLMDATAGVLSTINKYCKNSINSDIQSLWVLSVMGPSITAMLLDDELSVMLDSNITAEMEADLLKIYNRVSSLVGKDTLSNSLDAITAHAESYYNSESITGKDIKEAYIAKPYLIILAIMEVFTVPYLKDIGIKPLTPV